MIRRTLQKSRKQAERGVALIIAVMMLVALTGLALSTMASTGIDFSAARANAGALDRASCVDQVARYMVEQLNRDAILAAANGINNGKCSTAAIAYVNFTTPNGPIPEGEDGTQCWPAQLPCNPEGNQYMNLQFGGPASGATAACDFCGCTRGIALVAPTPYTPGGSLVGKSIGEGSKSDERRIGIRIVVADLPDCSGRYLSSYLDVAEVESIREASGSGDVAQ